jgi:hypothetical protein
MPKKPAETKKTPETAPTPAQNSPNPKPQLPINFCKILPKKKSLLVSHYNFLTNSQIMEIIFQYETFIQLLLQNYLFIGNKDKRLEIFNLIQKINLEKMQVLFMNGLRPCDVFLMDFKYGNMSLMTIKNYMASRLDMQSLPIRIDNIDQAVSFQMAPQVSVLQASALEVLNLVTHAVTTNQPKEKKLHLLKELVPFIQKSYIPVFQDDNKAASSFKFTVVDDTLLLAGLQKFGSKALSLVQENYLPHKNIDEIRNRFKNLTRFKSARNPIKNWKLLEIAPLTEIERQNLEKGKMWFGNTSFKLIARFFLPSRSEAFLRAQETSDKKLLAKRSHCYFELSDDNIESMVMDLSSDYIPDTPQQNKTNEDFLKFLRELPFKANLLSRLSTKPSVEDFSYFTFKLSENKMMLAKREKTEHDTLIVNQESILNSKIKILDNKVYIFNSQMNKNKAGVEHKFVDNPVLQGSKRIKTGPLVESVRQFCPNIREINDIVDRLRVKSEYKYGESEVFQTFRFE